MTDRYRDLADQLADVGRAAVARGLVVASGGNLSARCPDRDAFLVTGTGTWFDRLGPDDFALVGLDGAVLDGPEPSSEWRLHRATLRARPDVNAVVHLHPQTAVVLDALGYPVRLLTLDHVTYLRRIERVPYFPNGSDELADASAEASRECDVIVLANHGCSTLGAHGRDGLAARPQPRGGRTEHAPLPPARRHRHDVPCRPARDRPSPLTGPRPAPAPGTGVLPAPATPYQRRGPTTTIVALGLRPSPTPAHETTVS